MGFYFYLIVSNLVLRFTWTYKLTGLFSANWAIMLFTLLEAFRCLQLRTCLQLFATCSK